MVSDRWFVGERNNYGDDLVFVDEESENSRYRFTAGGR